MHPSLDRAGVVLPSPGWHPVLRAADAVSRHIVFVRLLGDEIALWRADDGRVNAWENRCPHRGMRLTMGTNTGSEVKCRYHGWRFASETAACAFIPAHPQQTPPKAAVVKTYRCAERYGLLWIAGGNATGEPSVPGLDGDAFETLRSVTVHAPEAIVRAALAFEPTSQSTLVLQRQSASVTTIHGIVAGTLSGAERDAWRRAENARLTALRDRLERATP